PAVGFELGFTRAPQTDTPLLTLQVSPAPHQPGRHMLQLRQLHLQLALVGTGPLRKDIQDHTGAIKHPALELALDITLLARAQGMIEQHHIGLGGGHRIPDFLKLALSHKKPRAGLLPGAGYSSNRLYAGGCHQFPELSRIFGIVVGGKINVNENRPFSDIWTLKQVSSTP